MSSQRSRPYWKTFEKMMIVFCRKNKIVLSGKMATKIHFNASVRRMRITQKSIEIDRSVMQSIIFEAHHRFSEILAFAKFKTYYKIEKSASHPTFSIQRNLKCPKSKIRKTHFDRYNCYTETF